MLRSRLVRLLQLENILYMCVSLEVSRLDSSIVVAADKPQNQHVVYSGVIVSATTTDLIVSRTVYHGTSVPS